MNYLLYFSLIVMLHPAFSIFPNLIRPDSDERLSSSSLFKPHFWLMQWLWTSKSPTSSLILSEYYRDNEGAKPLDLKAPLETVGKRAGTLKKYLAGDWINHLSVIVYHLLTSTNDNNKPYSQRSHLVNQILTEARRKAKTSFPSRKASISFFALL